MGAHWAQREGGPGYSGGRGLPASMPSGPGGFPEGRPGWGYGNTRGRTVTRGMTGKALGGANLAVVVGSWLPPPSPRCWPCQHAMSLWELLAAASRPIVAWPAPVAVAADP
jgi:hypothetical protein